ncbi:hypothetical protein Tco_0550724 [Tanacetum coccineum]
MIITNNVTFSGGSDDEGSVAANSVMHALADGDRGVSTPPRPPHPSQHHHHRFHHQMTYYHNCLIRRHDGQQDPPQGPPYPLPDRSQQCSLVIGLVYIHGPRRVEVTGGQVKSKSNKTQEAQPSMIKDKGKAIMIEPEVPLKRKDQVALDEDLARNLQAQLEAELIEEERLARKKEEEAT